MEAADKVLGELRDRVLAAASSKTPLRIRGGGSKDFYGEKLEGEILDTRAYRGVLAYDPPELVITARCGTPLAEIQALLDEQNQMLAFEPPHFGEAATIGGCVAAGLAGPRRASAGAVRDFTLGATLMDSRGQVMRFGGQVMKNVAGYDVARLLAGSLGTLALILDVSIKVLPLPVSEVSLRFACDQVEALKRLNQWAGRPLPISASAWYRNELFLRLSGARAAVEKAIVTLGGSVIEPVAAESLWLNLREHRHAFFESSAASGATLWRLALPSTAPPLQTDGDSLIEWGGSQRWLAGDESVREQARALGGHAVAFRGGSHPVFDTPAPESMAIQRRLKAAFDPAGIFNLNRMFSGF